MNNPGPVGAASLPSTPQVRPDVFGYAAAPSVIAPGPFGTPGAFSPFATTAIPTVVTAGTVVAAVAMRRGQPSGPATDAEIEDFLYDALELIPGTSEAEVRCEGGRVTLTGSVPHKRQKHDVGEIAWALPSVTDVQNSVTIATRRRARASARENDAQSSVPVRKHA